MGSNGSGFSYGNEDDAENDALFFRTNDEDDSNSPNTYDMTLPSKHEYLGHDFEELQGRTVYDEGSTIWIPLLFEANVVLLPGQILPLTVFYPPAVQMLSDLVKKKDRTMAVSYLSRVSNPNSFAPYGTTAEIFEWHQEPDVPGIKVKAVGRQRIQLLGQKRSAKGFLLAKVKILPEINLHAPFMEARLPSLNKYRKNGTFKEINSHMDYASIVWPRWVCDHYDSKVITRLIKIELQNLYYVSGSKLSESPEALSYQVMGYLPIDNETRVRLLALNTAVERLQYALTLLQEKNRQIFCAECGADLALRKDIILMSAEGPQGTYCNPQGYVHEIVTLSRVQRVIAENAPPSSEYSWFPGYGWNVANCQDCRCHVGWLFTAFNSSMRPQKFWGLSRASVKSRMTPTYNVEQQEDEDWG